MNRRQQKKHDRVLSAKKLRRFKKGKRIKTKVGMARLFTLFYPWESHSFDEWRGIFDQAFKR